ncbi:MAG: ABC transporter permease [Pirellulaceae bacterium]|nr:MAG: ABC transporter permease [Pirellulaceae bacterium]
MATLNHEIYCRRKALLHLSGVLAAIAVVALCHSTGCHRRAAPESSPYHPPADDRSAGAAAVRVRLQLNWFPEVEHGGYYTALLEGFFAQEGLDVQILPGSANTPVPQLVDSGRVELGVTNADQILLAADAGARLVALFAALQSSPRCVLVHQESPIHSWKDFRNVTLAVSSSATFLKYLTHYLPLDNVQIVAYSGNVAAFVANSHYAQQGYVFSEPFLAEKMGARPRVLMVSDLGYDPYTSVLVARESWLSEHPQLAERLIRACRRGWQEYLTNPQPTNRYILSVNPELPADVAEYGASAIRPLCLPEGLSADRLGTMTRARWEKLAQQMKEIGLLKNVDIQRVAWPPALRPDSPAGSASAD